MKSKISIISILLLFYSNLFAISTVSNYPVSMGTVLINTDFVIEFNSNIKLGVAGNIKIWHTSSNLTHSSYDVSDLSQTGVSANGMTLRINHSPDLNLTSAYHVTIDNGAIQDLASTNWVGYSNSTEWNFTSGASGSNDRNITGGHSHTLFLNDLRHLLGMGSNHAGQIGSVPLINLQQNVVDSNTTWRTVSSGEDFNLALKIDGTLWAWGENSKGQLGFGDFTQRNTPTQVGSDTDWSSISASGRSAFALKADGTLWSWGHNSHGQLGVGTTSDLSVPTQVGSQTTWTQIAAGINHTLGLQVDQTIYVWGSNGFGQLGTGEADNIVHSTPQSITGSWKQIAAGGFHSIGLTVNGEVKTWGKNTSGQLGVAGGNSPTLINADTNWISIAAGTQHSLFLKADGSLFGAGDNRHKQLTPTGTPIYNAQQIQAGYVWVSIYCGSFHSMATASDGLIHTWGNSNVGQTGSGQTNDISTPYNLNNVAVP